MYIPANNCHLKVPHLGLARQWKIPIHNAPLGGHSQKGFRPEIEAKVEGGGGWTIDIIL